MSAKESVHGASPYPGFASASNPQLTVIDRRVKSALNFGDTIAEIQVGPWSARTFFVHRVLLTVRSEYFKRATGDAWQGPECFMILPEDDPDIFGLYVNLVYTGSLATRGPDEWLKLCRLFVLAEKLQDTAAKNNVIDGMYSFVKEHTSKQALSWGETTLPIEASSIQELYNGTPEGSQARKFVADLSADYGRASWLQDRREFLPADFLYDVAIGFMQKQPIFGPNSLVLRQPVSNYHEIRVEDKSEAD